MSGRQAVVVSQPTVMLGKPVVAGTRVTVESVLERLAAGETVEQIADSHPALSVQLVRDVLAWAAASLAVERVIDLPGRAA